MPVRLMDCGLSPALSMMTREPDRVPVAVGVNVTVIEQDALAGRVAGQSEAVKSPAAAMLVMINRALPTLVSVTCCVPLLVTGWAGKVMLVHVDAAVAPPLVQVKLTAGPVVTPLPASLTVCGLPCALEVIVIEPVLVPVVVGRKVTLIEQPAPVAKPLPQLSASRKSPLGTMLLMISAAPPVLVSAML